jgi:predicted transcriptional regulator
METIEKVVEAPKLSRLAILRKLLNEECGYTKSELSEKTGIKLSTVNCQMYYHLPSKDFKIEKLAEKKFRFVREEVVA